MDGTNTNYRDYFADPSRTKNTTSKNKGQVYDAVFSDKDKDEVSINDFLSLMVAQLQNQDFMNPVDDTQFVTQMAQFATMKSMEEMAAYSKTNYALSLTGKNVTVAKFNVSGGVDRATGPVERVSILNDEYLIYVDGKSYTLDQIMEINGITGSGDDKIDVSKKQVQTEQVGGAVSLKWPKASSNSEIAPNLKYTVYYSRNEAMDTLEDIQKNGTAIGEPDRKDLGEENITGLAAGETYFFNVVVTDESGLKYVYKKSTLAVEEV